ncbi:MAG TPA: TAXI family TRAP transporter solute-binding subunit [Clostridia bacterium]|nr:TAXI family TRAP transporter solute-binding subunit [Clostridia bacterium]
MFLRKKLVAVVLLLMMLVAAAGCGGQGSSDQQSQGDTKTTTQFINIATGGTSGTYYPLGGAMADIFNRNIEGVNASAQSTGASVANINLLKDNEAQIAFVQNDIAYYAANGVEMFEGNRFDGLKGVATLYPETVQIITLADSNINSVADLKGKRVAVGAAGSGTEANARQILGAAGITYDDITVQYLSFGEAANNLKDGNVDAAFVTAGFPTAAVQDIAASRGVKLISLTDDIIAALIAEYPFYVETVIPSGTYPNQSADVKAVSVLAMLATNAELDEELVYNMLDALYSYTDRLVAAHPVGAQIKKETATEGMSIELHPGAQKFFEGE